MNSLLDHFKISPEARVMSLSRGQRAGLSLALTMATDPELLIFDDPSLGLDPVARRNVLEAIIHMTRESNRSVLFSSHQIDDVERVADQVAIMEGSVIRVQGSVDYFQENMRRLMVPKAQFDPESTALPETSLICRDRQDHWLIDAVASESLEVWCQEHKVTSNGLGFEEGVISYLSRLDNPRSLFQLSFKENS